MTRPASLAGGPLTELRIFRALRSLEVLNVAGVGAAISAGASAVLPTLFHDHGARFALAIAAPTFVVGAVWARLLRERRNFGKTKIRVGWLASVPLAMLNAAIVGALGHGPWDPNGSAIDELIHGAFRGVTVGAIVWIPALIAVLLLFGFPIARAQELAPRGIAGEERGERIVGLASLTVAIGSLAAQAMASEVWQSGLGHPLPASADGGALVSHGFAMLALGAAGIATILAAVREARRRRFVESAAAGKLAGYRIDVTRERPVLLRIESEGQGYRVADVEEEVAVLDPQGRATRTRG